MNCEQVRAQMSAWIDGELPPAEASELETHVATCANCRGEAESLRALHADLVRAFASPRAAAARAAERAIAGLPAVGEVARTEPRWSHVISLGLALAIGFLLAVLVFRPWKSPALATGAAGTSTNSNAAALSNPTQALLDRPVARLVVATSAFGVECSDRDRKNWEPVAEASKYECRSESGVRTGEKARCELVTSDGSVIRMNSGTEIVVHSPARIELRKGEIWCRSTATGPLEVVTALSSAVVHRAAPQAPVFSCEGPHAACFLRIGKTGATACVTAETGKVAIKANNTGLELAPRESAIITGEQVERDYSSNPLLDASWMQPLLTRKGHADRELAERVNDLLARVGETKEPELYETEIRSLGEYCILPLLRYVESPRSNSNPGRRTAAMRIISDLAPAWAIGDLIGLLGHADPDVRSLAAAALTRLTENTQGVERTKWRGPPGDWQPAAAVWQTWWNKNSDRFLHLTE
jgi:Putative zinc-finger/FecR protein